MGNNNLCSPCMHRLHSVSTLVMEICPVLETKTVTVLPLFYSQSKNLGCGASCSFIHFCSSGNLSLAECISRLPSFLAGSNTLPWSVRRPRAGPETAALGVVPFLLCPRLSHPPLGFVPEQLKILLGLSELLRGRVSDRWT